jgi:hypothetical protein
VRGEDGLAWLRIRIDGAVCVLDLLDYPDAHEATCVRILRLAGDAEGYDERKKENPWIHGVC